MSYIHWKVPAVNFPAKFKKIENEAMQTIRIILSQGDLILRQQLKDFESHFANFIGTKYAVGTSSGTDALHLSLRAAGVGNGDEVITVSHTFVATAAAIRHTGAKPVLIDIDDDHNMDVELIEQAITPRTKAIIPVHLNGRLCRMDRLMSIAQKHHLFVIEDAAQAFGASFDGNCAGSFGLMGCFSFYPGKILGAFGDGGMVVTDNKEMAEKLRSLRNHGRNLSGDTTVWGFNCRLDNLQAAVLDLKLRNIPEEIKRRREIAALYHRALSDLEWLRLPPPPTEKDYFFDVFQHYEILAENRDNLAAFLRQEGIEIMVPWGGKGVHQFPHLGLTHFHLPKTDELFRRVLILPITAELSNEQIEYVVQSIHDFYSVPQTLYPNRERGWLTRRAIR